MACYLVESPHFSANQSQASQFRLFNNVSSGMDELKLIRWTLMESCDHGNVEEEAPQVQPTPLRICLDCLLFTRLNRVYAFTRRRLNLQQQPS